MRRGDCERDGAFAGAVPVAFSDLVDLPNPQERDHGAEVEPVIEAPLSRGCRQAHQMRLFGGMIWWTR